jgi:hypothetical protein
LFGLLEQQKQKKVNQSTSSILAVKSLNANHQQSIQQRARPAKEGKN